MIRTYLPKTGLVHSNCFTSGGCPAKFMHRSVGGSVSPIVILTSRKWEPKIKKTALHCQNVCFRITMCAKTTALEYHYVLTLRNMLVNVSPIFSWNCLYLFESGHIRMQGVPCTAHNTANTAVFIEIAMLAVGKWSVSRTNYGRRMVISSNKNIIYNIDATQEKFVCRNELVYQLIAILYQ